MHACNSHRVVAVETHSLGEGQQVLLWEELEREIMGELPHKGSTEKRMTSTVNCSSSSFIGFNANSKIDATDSFVKNNGLSHS